MLGFSVRRKKGAGPVAIEQTPLQRFDTAEEQLDECQRSIATLNQEMIAFVKEHEIITDDLGQIVGMMSDSFSSLKVIERYNTLRLKRNELQNDFNQALTAWASAKEQLVPQDSA